MRSRAARNAAARWGEATPTITETSPTRSRPTRCQMTDLVTPKRRRARDSRARKRASAGPSCASYTSASTRPRGPASARTRPANTTTAPVPGPSSSRHACGIESGRAVRRTLTLTRPRTADGSRTRRPGAHAPIAGERTDRCERAGSSRAFARARGTRSRAPRRERPPRSPRAVPANRPRPAPPRFERSRRTERERAGSSATGRRGSSKGCGRKTRRGTD